MPTVQHRMQFHKGTKHILKRYMFAEQCRLPWRSLHRTAEQQQDASCLQHGSYLLSKHKIAEQHPCAFAVSVHLQREQRNLVKSQKVAA